MREQQPALFVIEAPGKVKTLEKSLKRLGMAGAKIAHTKGHFVRFPAGLRPLGITADYQTPGLSANPLVKGRLRSLAKDAVVYIATDDDQEGHLIAVDVYDAIKDLARRTVRMPLRDVSVAGVRQALERAAAVVPHTGRPAHVRRIVDRLIGYTYSRQGVACGRVSSALLAAFARRPPIIGHVVLSVPATDGGAPFVARLPVTKATLPTWRERQAALLGSQPVKVAKAVGKRTAPLNYAGLMQHLLRAHYEMRA